jgi:hypothetical protein
MSSKKLLQPIFGSTLVVLLLAGCIGAPASPTIISTPIPPTVTPAEILPTQQPIASPTTASTPIPPAVTPAEILPTAQPTEDPGPEEADQPDDDVSALRTALAVHFNVAPEAIQFGIGEQTEEHIKGSLPGGYFLAAREADAWVIVYDGQATPSCAQIAPYDFPLDMVPECLDENNGLVVRAANRPLPTKEAESGITIMGTVMDVSLSARIIMLQESVEGFSVVALTEESELVSTGSGDIALRDIRPGMTIQASGEPGESNALLASQVLLLDTMPTPPSD